ncbi:hypothetical protein HF521_003280 [Silurus meridionalis]|uniref:Breast cancer type 2 susceptibility protein n=1 Tax=Silurus meridionalis TaxID=175797 RepID=A0A8T0B735_SILME|nr:hypothetical protein HF521_003280 [Silurus meridionalis]
MFDDFFHKIELELGPLNSGWFEELTARASDDGGKNTTLVGGDSSAQKDKGIFRAPAKMPVLDSQSMCSTPRIFRCRRPHSPASGLEDSPDSGLQNLFPVLPGTESSPCLFSLAKDSQQFEKDWGSVKTSECKGLLDTPTGLTTQATSAQRICESLGAQFNPDLSWSSSFNTPSALTPTVILSKTEGQSSPVSLLRDKEVIIVRKLFPSLSKCSESTSASTSGPQHNDALTDTNDQAEEQKSDSSSINLEGVWRQTVPDAIKDGDVRNTVESVLNDAEDVLSFFFTNSGSALRRVKTRERKKRVNAVSKEVKSSPVTVDHTTDCTSASKTAAGCFKSPLFSSQLNNKDFTQWTPLSLSDVQDPKTNHAGVFETPSKLASLQQQRSSPDPSHGRCAPLDASPALTFSRKPRKFVYPVQNSESKRTHSETDAVLGKHSQEASPCQKEDAHGDQPEEDGVKQDHPGRRNVDHDLDMSQLCKAFSEDFTQETNSFKSPHKSAQSGVDCGSTPTCAPIEISKVQDKKELMIPLEGNFDHQAAVIPNLTHIQSLESRVCDSGCPTVCSGFSLETRACSGAELLPSGFKTANNKIIVVPPEALQKAKASFDEFFEHTARKDASSPTDPANGGTKRRTPYESVLANPAGEKPLFESSHPGREAGRESDESVLRSEGAAESIPSTFLCQTNKSGFKTTSNKSITVSSENLEKAKYVFMELEEEKFDSRPSNKVLQVSDVKEAQPSKFGLKNSRKPTQRPSGNDEGSSSLTASQKADVTELCSMLEEVGSQYEFTQFNHAKIGSRRADSMQFAKEWDPEILADIDFDDSFNSELTDEQASKKHWSKADVHASVLNGGVAISNAAAEESGLATDTADDNLQEKSFCPGFKTAKGNAVKISERCLSKARSLFADIEDTDGNFGLQSDGKADDDKQEKQSGDHQDDPRQTAPESESELKPRFNPCNGNGKSSTTEEAATCKQRCSKVNLETLQRTIDEKPVLNQRNMVNLGFTTAGGKDVKISEKALRNAKKLLDEAANDQETKSPTKTKALISGHNSFNMLADALYDSKICSGSVPKDGNEHQFENGTDITQATRSAERNGFKTAAAKKRLSQQAQFSDQKPFSKI